MDSVYENASGEKCSQFIGNSTNEQKNVKVVYPSKWIKVLLIVFSVCLFFALGGLCILGILYIRVSMQLYAQETNGTNYKGKFDALRNQHEETLRKLNRCNDSTSCAHCAIEWIHFGGKCYYYSKVKMNWTQSRDHCVTLGGHLVIINSKAEQDFVISKVKGSHWIGLNDLDIEGHFVWVNNQALNNSLEFWMKREDGNNEPDNWTKNHPAGEDCTCLGHLSGASEFWLDDFCFEEKKFVCETAAAV
ncbi:hepatic lectin-like [Carassius gibelio]|uniref:hepatic lectin-like n=1 Tax=Carassius gibelio TaxID=101364 RepID=UPI0022781CED|nr:hepatic lectin-like [Carassius gibelio]